MRAIAVGEELCLNGRDAVSSGNGSIDTAATERSDPPLVSRMWQDATDRHGVETQRVRLAEIVRCSDDAIVSLDADFRIRTWNRAAEAVYGYTSLEVLGKPADVLIPPDATIESRGLYEHAVAGGRVRRYQTQRLHKDGTLVDVAITAFAEVDAGGDVTGVTTITRDVTEQTRAGRALAESEERYREILATTQEGVWRVDADQLTNYVNPRMADMLGYPPEEMIGHTLLEFMDVERHGVAERELETTQSKERSGVVEHCFLRKDGTRCWTRVSLAPLTDPNGTHAGTLAIVSDITASKAQAAALRASELFVAALNETIVEGVCSINVDGRMTYMNQAAEKLLGWTADELATVSMHDAVHYQHDDGSPQRATDSPILGVLRSAATVRVENDTFTRRDGRLLPVAYSASPITIEGRVHGVVIVFTDASTRWAADQRRARELENLNWVGRIRDALDEERLVLYAQPIMDVRSREVVMYELLLRMVDSDGTIIAPGRFLPAAEQYGLIEDIDRWVLAEAIKLAARGQKVHFNISGKSLGSRVLINDLTRLLNETGADPGLLICEITETALASDEALNEAFVHDLSALGCQIALDDFGVGYGGFAYLKRLPITVIKIDIQFVRDLDTNYQNQHIVKATVNLAQGFGRQTVAEGVEAQALLELLEQYGVDYAQGFAIGLPAPVERRLEG